MFCGNCGTELTEGAKFCPNCGAPAPAVVEEREADTPGPESARPRRRLAAPPSWQPSSCLPLRPPPRPPTLSTRW